VLLLADAKVPTIYHFMLGMICSDGNIVTVEQCIDNVLHFW